MLDLDAIEADVMTLKPLTMMQARAILTELRAARAVCEAARKALDVSADDDVMFYNELRLLQTALSHWREVSK